MNKRGLIGAAGAVAIIGGALVVNERNGTPDSPRPAITAPATTATTETTRTTEEAPGPREPQQPAIPAPAALMNPQTTPATQPAVVRERAGAPRAAAAIAPAAAIVPANVIYFLASPEYLPSRAPLYHGPIVIVDVQGPTPAGEICTWFDGDVAHKTCRTAALSEGWLRLIIEAPPSYKSVMIEGAGWWAARARHTVTVR